MKVSGPFVGERRTSFGRIPEMPEEVADSKLAVIFLREPGDYEAKPIAVLLPGQLYQKKLSKLMDKGVVFVAGATHLFEVSRSGGKGSRVSIGTTPGGERKRP